MWLRPRILLLNLALGATLVAGCKTSDETARRSLAAEIAMAQKEDRLADFAKGVPGDWDLVHVFGPYTSRERIEQQLGFRWLTAELSAIQQDDSVCLFVFVKGRRVVTWIDFTLADGDPDNIIKYGDTRAVFPRDKARFRVRTDADGLRVLEHPHSP